MYFTTSTNAIVIKNLFPDDIMNKILLEHWLNAYEDQAEIVDLHVRKLIQMNVDRYHLDKSIRIEQQNQRIMRGQLNTMAPHEVVRYEDVIKSEKRVCRMKKKIEKISEKRKAAKQKIDSLGLELCYIRHEVNGFAHITGEFEIRDKRFAMIEERGLQWRY